MFRRFTDKGTASIKVRRSDTGSVIEGYAAVFYRAEDPGTEYRFADDDVGEVRERVMPGAFDRALAQRHDVRGLFNHDKGAILGRASSGTLRLSVDERGLKYEIDVPDTQVGRDTVTSIERGDLSGSSFAFSTPHGGSRWRRDEPGSVVRELRDLDLFDVGPVTFPAYESTTTSTRDAESQSLRREFDEFLQSTAAISVRMRQLDIDDSLVICD